MRLQRDRWALWLAPALIAGAACWLAAPTEPPLWLSFGGCASAAAVLGAFALLTTGRPNGAVEALRRAGIGVAALAAAFAVGAVAAQVRTWIAREPAYVGSRDPVEVTGWVSDVDASDAGPRLRLLVSDIEGVASPPRYVRLAVRAAGLLSPGRAAHCRAVLGAPSGPLAPGGYDFARRAFFDRLGASGFAFGRCRPLPMVLPDTWLDRLRLRLAALRADLSAAISEAAPGRGGAIAVALITGDVSGVDKETNTGFRNSGLGHLLSVSGVHMGVVGGLVFAAITSALSLIGPIALRVPVKKIAAVAALGALAAYLLISGASVPALRSFIMACVAFGAVLLDRPAISMRGVALSAGLVTLALPESVLEPGFQMSFAATAALVALFEIMKQPSHEPRLPAPGLLIGAMQGLVRSVGGVLLISVVAGFATDPFAVYHFQRFSLYALPANLIAEPIISFLVAPAASVAALLAPFGLGQAPLQFMASALELVASIGVTFGGRGEAVMALPQPPALAFLLCVAALNWACLWSGWLRLGALPLLGFALAAYVEAPTPLAAFDSELRAVFVRDGHSWDLVSGNGRSTYARDHLGAMLGLPPPVLDRLAAPDACNEHACTWRLRRRALVLVRDAAGFAVACAGDAVIIARAAAPAGFKQRCRLNTLIDAADLTREGGGFIYAADGAGLVIQRATPPTIRRAWTPSQLSFDKDQP